MKYSEATVSAYTGEGHDLQTIDLEDIKSTGDLIAALWELFPAEARDEDDEPDTDEMPPHVTLCGPEGFAVHLFTEKDRENSTEVEPVDSFDEIAEPWSNESDEDRREAMGEYLEDMGADDLSDFDEAYEGQYSSGAAFAEHKCEELGDVPEGFPSWIAIDWEQTWEGGLRFDYTITDSGHVFRNM